MNKNHVVVIKNLYKKYGEHQVLNNINLKIEETIIFGLLGPNGAGKTTLMEIIVGLRKHTSGSIEIHGEKDIDENTLKTLIGYVPQEPLLYPNLSGYDNIKFFAKLYNLDDKEITARIKNLKEILGLDHDTMKKTVSKLSGGQKKKISILSSLIHDPQIIVMDEPTTGLDPNVRREFWNFIMDLNHKGKTIILSTHYMEEADELCQDIAIINEGKIIAEGGPEELKKIFGGGNRLSIKVKSRFIDKTYELIKNKGFNPIKYFDNIILKEISQEDIAKLREYIENNGIVIESLELRKPTLDDVFINLTGRRLIEQ